MCFQYHPASPEVAREKTHTKVERVGTIGGPNAQSEIVSILGKLLPGLEQVAHDLPYHMPMTGLNVTVPRICLNIYPLAVSSRV